jgi:hypothetical protein
MSAEIISRRARRCVRGTIILVLLIALAVAQYLYG